MEQALNPYNIPIYTSADWNYRVPLRVMLDSLAANVADAPFGQQVVVLTDPDSQRRFEEARWGIPRLCLLFRGVNPAELAGLPVYGHVGAMTYLRLFMESPAVCPESRVLYLDSDILIRKSIAPLLRAVAEQQVLVMGVREVGTGTVAQPSGVFNWQKLGLSADQPYINAGVLGLNMDLIRQGRWFSRALEYLHRHGRDVHSHDQGALNAILGAEVKLISSVWNFTSAALTPKHFKYRADYKDGRLPELKDVVIAHFTGSGSAKPWHVNCTSPFTAEYRVYFLRLGGVLSADTRLEKLLGYYWSRQVRKMMRYLRYARCYR